MDQTGADAVAQSRQIERKPRVHGNARAQLFPGLYPRRAGNAVDDGVRPNRANRSRNAGAVFDGHVRDHASRGPAWNRLREIELPPDGPEGFKIPVQLLQKLVAQHAGCAKNQYSHGHLSNQPG